MRVESSFFDKSSARFILTRARGLRILTFDKIRKTENKCKIRKTRIKTTKIVVILSKSDIPQKNDVKKIFMGHLQTTLPQTSAQVVKYTFQTPQKNPHFRFKNHRCTHTESAFYMMHINISAKSHNFVRKLVPLRAKYYKL